MFSGYNTTISDRIRQHSKSQDRGETEAEVVVIVDESSNPESTAGGSSSQPVGDGVAPTVGISSPAFVRFVTNSPLVSPVASPQPAQVRGNASAWASQNDLGRLQGLELQASSSLLISSLSSPSCEAQRFLQPKLPASLVTQHPLKPLPTPRTDPTVPPGFKEHGINLVGDKYLLLDHLEGSHLQRCIDVRTQQEYVCKTVRNDPIGQAMLSSHMRVDGHPHINPVHEVLVGEASTYIVFPPCHVDLHSYVRTKRRLREPQARALFRQIVSAVHEAHSKGIVLRDLKLRKFVFTDDSRTTLKLESLEDAVVLEDEEHDLLSDKHGCPAYVSPEILRRDAIYSGRAADMWGLGVMLYTMLVGRYPFHGQEHTGLFAKIRRGQFTIPDSISSRAKCLIRCLLRKEPEERLTTEDVLVHPWINQHSSSTNSMGSSSFSSTSLLSASSAASSGHRSSTERSSRHHRSSSSATSSASTPMSVAPPSVYPQPPSGSNGHHLHPTLIRGSGSAGSGSSSLHILPHSGAAAMPPAYPVASFDYQADQTVPESFSVSDE